jgi:hypothetical protein
VGFVIEEKKLLEDSVSEITTWNRILVPIRPGAVSHALIKLERRNNHGNPY